MKRRVVFSESDSDSDFETSRHTKKAKEKSTEKLASDSTFDDESKVRGKVQLSLKESISKQVQKRDTSKSSKTIESYFSPNRNVLQKKTEVSVDDFFSSKNPTKHHHSITNQPVPVLEIPQRTPEAKHPQPSKVSSCSSKNGPTKAKKYESNGPQMKTPPHHHPPHVLVPDTPIINSPASPSVSVRKRFSPQKSPGSRDGKSKLDLKKEDTIIENKPDTAGAPATPVGRRSFWSYQSREGPRNLGSKPIPHGKPNCLKGKSFLITGVLDSIEREDAHALIERCGGKVMKTLGKKTDFLVVGREPGQGKMAKAESLSTSQLDEDSFFDFIRTMSQESITEGQQTTGCSISPAPAIKSSASPSKNKVSTSSIDGPLTARPVLTEEAKVKLSQPSSTKMNDSKSTSVSPQNHVPVCQELWVDKYRPTSRRTLVGQTGPCSPANKLFAWLESWHKNFTEGAKARAYSSWPGSTGDDGKWARAALLSGPPGIGKTSTAGIVCVELGFTSCELNASDCRSKRSLADEISQMVGMQNLAQMALGHSSFLSSKTHILLMDEVDGMAGNEDRGGMQELISIIKSTKMPIICMCNDRQSPKVRSLANYCFDLRFHRPRVEQIKAAVLSIACKEQVNIPAPILTEIIQASNQDIRQVINNTQMWCSTGSIDEAQLSRDAVGARKDLHLSAFDVIRKVFSPDISSGNGLRGGGQATFNDSLDLFFQDYSLMPLFVQENYLQVNYSSNPNKLLQALAYCSKDISTGDVISRAIRESGTGSWSLLPVQGVFSVVAPGRTLRGPLPGGPGPSGGVSFPSWFGKNSNQSRMNRLAGELSHHLRLATHGGSSSARSLLMDYASTLADSLTRPLKEGDVETALTSLVHYQLQREDLDNLMELATWPDRPNRMQGIDSKVKASLTRQFNKSVHLFPYALNGSGVIKTTSKRNTVRDELMDDDEDDTAGLFDQQDNSDGDGDIILKVKSSKTKRPPPPSTSNNNNAPAKKPKRKEKESKTVEPSSSSSSRGGGGSVSNRGRKRDRIQT